jgi:hypothetical protein
VPAMIGSGGCVAADGTPTGGVPGVVFSGRGRQVNTASDLHLIVHLARPVTDSLD